MAVYSKPTVDDLATIAETYGLSEVQRLVPYSQGSENSNFFVKTADANYVLTICENKSAEAVQVLVETLRHLEKYGFRTTRVITTLDGRGQSVFHGKPLLLKSHLPGDVLDQLPFASLYDLGKTLGQLHLIPALPLLPCQLAFGRETFEILRNEYAQQHPFLDWLMDIESYLNELIVGDLPRSLIHGDVFADNVVLNPKLGLAIMDFEEAANYYRLFDVGMTRVGTCQRNGRIDPAASDELLRGYREAISLLPIEEELLEAFTVYAAASMASWRFRQFNIVFPDLGMREHYRELQQLACSILDPSN